MTGVGPALLTVPIFWGSYWPIYNRMNAYFAEQTQINQHLSHLLSAITAGAIGDVRFYLFKILILFIP